jgi:hypothetical protein
VSTGVRRHAGMCLDAPTLRMLSTSKGVNATSMDVFSFTQRWSSRWTNPANPTPAPTIFLGAAATTDGTPSNNATRRGFHMRPSLRVPRRLGSSRDARSRLRSSKA